MKKFLPILFTTLLAAVVFILPRIASAQTPPPAQQMQQGNQVPDGNWVIDKEVTFIGKNAARSGNLLDFTLKNYSWVCVKQVPNTSQCDNSNNPLEKVWVQTRNYIVAPLLLIVILAASIIIIMSRGRSLTITRFLPRFIVVLLLIFLSFSLLRFIYTFIDIIQGFFLRADPGFVGKPCPPDCISQKDLLFVGWDYKSFIGLRLIGGTGDQNAESAFISLLLTKLTALTYYVMVGILTLRRIILWLFIIVSPIFPILLFFYPVRNTAKIWIGEFFRWLLYAPLFAIFLKGLVNLWRDHIPLVFDNAARFNENAIIYPTAVNILLGGPKEYVTPANSVNLTETFALYVVSLIMLWGVIILPWILLQIFLDYASNMNVSETPLMKSLVNRINNLQGPPGAHPPAGGGTSISLPFAKKFNLPTPPSAPTGMAREIPTSTSKSISNVNTQAYMPSAQVKAQVLSLTNLSIPSLRDIAKYDTSLISRDSDRQKETTIIQQNLEKIANPAVSSSSTEREKYTEIREKLTKESSSGNTLATSILSAAQSVSTRSVKANTNQIKNILTQIANPSTTSTAGATSVINKEKITKMNESLVNAKRQGNDLAASILSINTKTSDMELEKLQERIMDAKAKGEPIATQVAAIAAGTNVSKLPAVNRVQTVSKEDYQAVKDMWKDNYRNLDVPAGISGARADWIKEDMGKIEEIIALLSSTDEEQINKGMEQVSSILPFLLVGGFSQAEIVSYLKAKLEAAKDVAAEIVAEDEEKVEVKVKKTATASQTLSAALPDSSGDDDSSLGNLPTSTSGTQIKSAGDDVLKLTNLESPKLTDIVQYEVRHLTKDKKESERVQKIQEVLEKIANPASVSTDAERQQYELLQEKLAQESTGGNSTANAILSAVSQMTQVAGRMDATLSDVKSLLIQISNSEKLQATDDRDYYTRLHDYLKTESTEKGNTLAQKVLNVNESTKLSEIKTIRDELNSSTQGAGSLPQLSSAVSDYSTIKKLRNLIGQILNPSEKISKPDKERLAALSETITKENARGNVLASKLLSVNEKTSDAALKELHDKLVEAGKSGDSLASSIISQTTIPSAFAETSRMQEVTPEEYEEVSALWQKAYKQYLVPQGYTEDQKGREEWISRDISDIQETVSMLNSTDADTRNKGADKVSSILPFLLLGGYSFDEVNNYLKIKLQAAQNALTDLQKEEEDMVSVGVKKTIATATQKLSSDIPTGKSSETSGQSEVQSTQNISNPLILQEVLNVLDVKLPTLKDIATYDVASHTTDKTKQKELEKIHGNFAKLYNPANIVDTTERAKFESLKEKLSEESKNQNRHAHSVLNAVSRVQHKDIKITPDGIKKILMQIADPALVVDASEKQRYSEIHDLLLKTSLEGNKLSGLVLSVSEKTTTAEVENIKNLIDEGVITGDSIANQLGVFIGLPQKVELPGVNESQEVQATDYDEVKKIWKENYLTLIAEESPAAKSEWIKGEISNIDNILSLITSPDATQVQIGMNEVSNILPFILLGGFTKEEIIAYLRSKQEAAEEVLDSISKDEENKVNLPSQKSDNSKEASAKQEEIDRRGSK